MPICSLLKEALWTLQVSSSIYLLVFPAKTEELTWSRGAPLGAPTMFSYHSILSLGKLYHWGLGFGPGARAQPEHDKTTLTEQRSRESWFLLCFPLPSARDSSFSQICASPYWLCVRSSLHSPQIYWLLWHKLEEAKMHEAASLTFLVAFLRISCSCSIYNIIKRILRENWVLSMLLVSPLLFWSTCKCSYYTKIVRFLNKDQFVICIFMRSQTLTRFLLLLPHKHFI